MNLEFNYNTDKHNNIFNDLESLPFGYGNAMRSEKVGENYLGQSASEMDIIDIILVPYPLMNAWSRESRMQREIAEKMDNDAVKEFSSNWEFALLKMRTCHLSDRVDKLNYHDNPLLLFYSYIFSYKN